MKKNFLTGVAILFPIVLTYMVIHFFVNLFTEPFLGLAEIILPFGTHALAVFLSKLLILLALVLIFWLVGILGRLFIGNFLFQAIDSLAHRIPGIRRIYKIIQEAIQTVFNGTGSKFSRVVLVPFPHSKSYSLGFVTNEKLSDRATIIPADLVAVFVPGTPIPTIGYTLLFKRHHILSLNMSIEDGLKFILSFGANSKNFTISTQSNQSKI